MKQPEPIRTVIVGTARRSAYLYGPLLHALPDVELVGVWGRSEGSAHALGQALGVPASTDLHALIKATGAVAGVVSVAYSANGEVGQMAAEHDLHLLLETPVAHHLREADAIIATARERGLKVEVAEQFHRRPLEQLKLTLLESGLFGEVFTAFNDFAGHGYHGVSVLRSYVGFDAAPTTVAGATSSYALASHWSRLAERHAPRTETQEHGIIRFATGQTGIYHWSDVAYDSALRWWRSSRFLAERGMGVTWGVEPDVTCHLTLLASGGEAPRPIVVERRYRRNDGGPLEAMVAHTGDPDLPIVRWDNPFADVAQWNDDEIGVAGCVMSLVDAIRSDSAPSYGAEQGRLDQEVSLAIRLSARRDGEPVALPLNRDIDI
ncbi:MAG: Gfo/Idh/MocA family oxidoreductase [Candidatus Promineifilaceae bacterium]|nr:Gfo/Idh/MocA family oxidoreductase [Candidatus Promineifilaceae bacterium]